MNCSPPGSSVHGVFPDMYAPINEKEATQKSGPKIHKLRGNALKKKQKEKRKLHVKLTLGILVKEGLKKK